MLLVPHSMWLIIELNEDRKMVESPRRNSSYMMNERREMKFTVVVSSSPSSMRSSGGA
jgi:hypothetical protein